MATCHNDRLNKQDLHLGRLHRSVGITVAEQHSEKVPDLSPDIEA